VTPLPPPTTTQQDLDLAEKLVKWTLSVAALAGVFAGLVKWLRKRRAARDERYATRIENIVRSRFTREIKSVEGACTNLEELKGYVLSNTIALGDLQRETIKAMQAGDEMVDQFISLVRDNREWLDDLQNFTDHVHGIDRRSSIGADRRQRIDSAFDDIQERRQQRRRTEDKMRDDFSQTRKRESELKNPNDHGEVT
jgi:hypothetical protein